MKKLNKISILFLSLLVLIMASCENEPLEGDFEDGSTPPTSGLIGTWALLDFNTTISSTTIVGGMTIESSSVVDGMNPNYDLTFTANTFTTSGNYGYSATTTVNGVTNSQDLSVENVMGSGSYTVNANEMTTDGAFFSLEFMGMDLSDFQGEQTIAYVISPDGQTLTFTQNTTETNGAGGATTTSTITGSSVWTKGATNNSCADASDFASAAEVAYNNDSNNTDLCNAYKAALQNQINACGDATGELQSIIDGLGDCISSFASIIGTWEEIAFTSNGETFPDLCIGDIETYTATTYHYSEIWGDNCEKLNGEGPEEPYTLNGNQLTIEEEGTPYTYEVIELTETTLKYQDVYVENGVNITDIYTFEKQ